MDPDADVRERRLLREQLPGEVQREKKHPEDALPIYLSQIEPTLRATNDKAYRAAVDLLKRIHGLMVRLGKKAEFAGYLESLRMTHKVKRKLLKLLARTQWA